MPLAGPLPAPTEAGRVAALARRLHTTVLAGVTAPAGSTRFVNEIVAWGPSGRILGRSRRPIPSPSASTCPCAGLFSRIASLTAVPRDVVVGRNDGELTTPAGRVAILNSFEDFLRRPGPQRGAGRRRAARRRDEHRLVRDGRRPRRRARRLPDPGDRRGPRPRPVGDDRLLGVRHADRGRLPAKSRLGTPDLLRARVALRTGATLYDGLATGWSSRSPPWPSSRRCGSQLDGGRPGGGSRGGSVPRRGFVD